MPYMHSLERRKEPVNEEDLICPKHGIVYRYSTMKRLICSAPGCTWEFQARREEDSKYLEGVPKREDSA